MSRKVAEIVVSLLIIIGGLALCGVLIYNMDKEEEKSKQPVKIIKDYEVSREYLESPFDYESEIEGRIIEVRGTITSITRGEDVNSEEHEMVIKEITVNDNIICDVAEINDSHVDLEDAEVVVRGTVVSEATTLELDECDVKVLSKPE